MGENIEQEEELEVLRSIYDEDDCFREVNDTTFQYRFGDSGESKSFLLEIKWPESYPECLPHINLNAFYNRHIPEKLKETIIEKILTEMGDNVGMALTFTIINWVGENFEQLLEHIEEMLAKQPKPDKDVPTVSINVETKPAKEKKIQLTKQQKRKLADRTNYKGERERGWNWVDIVKHLSKTG
ncbi:RWD domain-containing protein 4-like [Xenia sp. Carnegie-2017]|uniref:RWD domain-containing protein 4-like n=1 Tax=Xenia sp. Carnegie-2017 TaxID=2897299 RepID=UPI001F0483AF|nr:RWD domain-containing protein 4-like [Xenia sp. Carnegie-2017]